MERPTFSQSWSRVSKLTPTLRPHVQITRQLYRGEPWYVVHDPISNHFFRLNPVAYHLVGLLDSRRTIDEVWHLTLQRFGDLAPTQNEVIGLLAQLNESNLLRVDLPPDAEPLLRRARKRQMKQWGNQAMSILFLRIPLFNPDKLLKWLLPLFRPVLSIAGLAAWGVWMIFVTWQFAPHLTIFLRDAQSILAPNNWGWMVALFIATKIFHELGHGLICKRFGGIVPDVGIMMLVLFPVPYVDATSVWSFSSRWKRLLVGAGGMLFELVVAGAAALVWLHAEPGSLAKQLSYNVVFMASVATILFNANPLLKYDGYYMLSDLLEIPNLYDRSSKHLQWLVQRFLFGLTNAQPVSTRRGEQWLLLSYGIVSQIYRFLVLFGIVLFIAGQLYAVGLLLAVWSVIAWVLVPIGKFLHWLVTHPSLQEHRLRAMTASAAVLAVLLGSLGVIPVPEHYRTEGVVESTWRTDLSVQSDGFVTQVLAEVGRPVEPQQIILVMENPDLQAKRKELQAQLQGLQWAQRQALAEDQVQMKSAEARIEATREELTKIAERIDSLVVRSPHRGILVGPTLAKLEGQFLQRGQVVTQVADLASLRVTALVEQGQNAALFDHENSIRRVELRTAGRLDRTLNSRLLRIFPSGRSELPHPALGYAGGGSIAVRTDDPHGQTAVRPLFELWLELPKNYASGIHGVAAFPGQRVYVRLTLQQRSPLLAQWVHRLRQLFRERLSI